uniref:Lipocalin n=1 Tax=Rhipicephalus appendiculatus TaxID=34631 RepID=A0A131Z351_RHIAP
MATVIALVLLALAVAEASLNLHDLALYQGLLSYQDPSRFIWSNTTAYLLRVSVLTDTVREELQLPCVRSRYWSNTTEKVERSIEVYNKTEHSPSRSINISLTVGSTERKNILNVYPRGPDLSFMKNAVLGFDISSGLYNYTYLVLFSDTNCLILAETLKTANAERPWLQCSMWLSEHRIKKPPRCCQFIFQLLCAYMDEGVQVFDNLCLEEPKKAS